MPLRGPPTAPAWPPAATTAPSGSGTPSPASPSSTSPATPGGCQRWPGSTTRIWDLTSGTATSADDDGGDVVTAAAWSPDGARLATIETRWTVRIGRTVRIVGPTGTTLTPPRRRCAVGGLVPRRQVSRYCRCRQHSQAPGDHDRPRTSDVDGSHKRGHGRGLVAGRDAARHRRRRQDGSCLDDRHQPVARSRDRAHRCHPHGPHRLCLRGGLVTWRRPLGHRQPRQHCGSLAPDHRGEDRYADRAHLQLKPSECPGPRP